MYKRDKNLAKKGKKIFGWSPARSMTAVYGSRTTRAKANRVKSTAVTPLFPGGWVSFI